MSKERQIIDLLTINPFISQREIAEKVGLSRPAVANYIANLTKKGIIKGRAYILEKKTILCIGAANLDRKAKTLEPVQLGTSNPVQTIETFGGVAYNFAKTLQKLGIHTSLLTAVGDDALGISLLQKAKSHQIDTSHVWIFPDEKTGTFTTLIDSSGKTVVSMADMKVYERITLEMIKDKWPNIQLAKAVFLDTNFKKEVLQDLLQRLKSSNIPIFLDAVSPIKGRKLPKDLTNVKLLTLSLQELQTIASLKEISKKSILEGTNQLLKRGIENILLFTEGNMLHYFSTKGKGNFHWKVKDKPLEDKERNIFSAKVMYHLIEGKTLEETMKILENN